jgi:hypothetical protein
MRFLEFTFQSAHHFIGMLLLLGGFGTWSLRMVNRFMRHWNIRKHGYPPVHCDADGDQLLEFEPEEKGNKSWYQ